MPPQTGAGSPPTRGRNADPARKQPRATATRRWLLLALLSGLVLWITWALAGVARAAREAAETERSSQATMSVILDRLSATDSTEPLRRVHSRLLRARRHLGWRSTLPLRILPVAGRQVASLDAMIKGAARITEVLIQTTDDGRKALQAPHGTGPQRVELLQSLARVAATADRRLAAISLGPRHLLPPVSGVHDRLADRLARARTALRRAVAGTTAVADVLGGPRRYLVLAANNAEMRVGSGMFLSVGTLESGQGAFALTELRPSSDLAPPPGAVSIDGDMAARWGWLHPEQEWRNLGMTPRFDASASLAARMWQARGGPPADGVLAVDAVALRSVLTAVGPVEVEGRMVNAANVVDLLLHGQYVEHAGELDQGPRRDALGRVAESVMSALQQRNWDVMALARELVPAARGRHLLAWSSDSAVQLGWTALGVDGGLNPDSLLVGLANRGGNKLDRSLTVTADLASSTSGGYREVVLRLRLVNPPADGEPSYVAGPCCGLDLARGTYLGIVAVSLPGNATAGRIDGESRLVAAGRDGPTRVVASMITLGPGGEHTVVVRFRLPLGSRSIVIEPSARVPPIRWVAGSSRWDDERQRVLRWKGRRLQLQ